MAGLGTGRELGCPLVRCSSCCGRLEPKSSLAKVAGNVLAVTASVEVFRSSLRESRSVVIAAHHQERETLGRSSGGYR